MRWAEAACFSQVTEPRLRRVCCAHAACMLCSAELAQIVTSSKDPTVPSSSIVDCPAASYTFFLQFVALNLGLEHAMHGHADMALLNHSNGSWFFGFGLARWLAICLSILGNPSQYCHITQCKAPSSRTLCRIGSSRRLRICFRAPSWGSVCASYGEAVLEMFRLVGGTLPRVSPGNKSIKELCNAPLGWFSLFSN